MGKFIPLNNEVRDTARRPQLVSLSAPEDRHRSGNQRGIAFCQASVRHVPSNPRALSGSTTCAGAQA